MGKILLAARKKVGRTDKVEIKRLIYWGRGAHQPWPDLCIEHVTRRSGHLWFSDCDHH